MAYKELVKDFSKIRDYMREFYVYGFKSRDDFNLKSDRTYDDEKRRISSWLGDYMNFNSTVDGKSSFLSIDSRAVRHNPLYKAWKTKSFTDKDITLHFILFDILSDDTGLTLKEILDEIDEYVSDFDEPMEFEESTVRKKLKEYSEIGIVTISKTGRQSFYSLPKSSDDIDADVLDFYSEVAPCGVIGSFILDKEFKSSDSFTFKHHYITSTMDSDIRCKIFAAIQNNSYITMQSVNRKKEVLTDSKIVPLKVFVSVQNGRQHLIAYNENSERMIAYRIDYILSVKEDEICEDYSDYIKLLEKLRDNLWGVSFSGSNNRMEHVEFIVRYENWEQHIPGRLEREKRCGKVTHLGDGRSKFEADVFDSRELFPWIRTFISRIEEIHFSNKMLEKRFKDDILKMYEMYGLNEQEDECDEPV